MKNKLLLFSAFLAGGFVFNVACANVFAEEVPATPEQIVEPVEPEENKDAETPDETVPEENVLEDEEEVKDDAVIESTDESNPDSAKADTSFVATVTDAGEVISKMVITYDADEVKDVDKDTYKVVATSDVTKICELANTDAYVPQVNTVTRTIEKVETSGNTVTVYFNTNEGSTLTYLKNAHNYPSQLTYVVTQNKEITLIKNGAETKIGTDTQYNVPYTDYINGGKTLKYSDPEVEKFTSEIVSGGLNYEYYTPENADADTLIVWFHGNGEGDFYNTNGQISNNNVVQLLANRGGVAWTTDEAQATYGGAYVMAFQAPDMWYYATKDAKGYAEMAYNEIKAFVEKNGINPNKLIVAGCSAGGYMSLQMLMDYPDFFAAAMINCPAIEIVYNRTKDTDVVCQNPTDEQLKAIANSKTKIWFVQSDYDSTVGARNGDESADPENTGGAKRVFALLTEGQDLITTEISQEHYSDMVTKETKDGKYLLTTYKVYDINGVKKIRVDEDFNQDGILEENYYGNHWSWIFTLLNNPVNAEGEHIWKWSANAVAQPVKASRKAVNTAVNSNAMLYLGLAFIALAGMAAVSRKKN